MQHVFYVGTGIHALHLYDKVARDVRSRYLIAFMLSSWMVYLLPYSSVVEVEGKRKYLYFQN